MQRTIQKQTHKTKKKNAWKYILSVLIILIYILPIYVLVVMAFKHPTDLGSRLIPPNYFDLSNFTSIIESGKLFRALGNTILIAVGTVAIEVVFGCMAAYAFARNRSRLNSFMQSFCLGIMMIPPAVHSGRRVHRARCAWRHQPAVGGHRHRGGIRPADVHSSVHKLHQLHSCRVG